ncbi:MAG: hypothetical protein RQ985_06745 [Dehalococcoidia bacterium]|jgi:hypothetical protein|nr:hypothetical protein [Dehalococcoidia bacterium]
METVSTPGAVLASLFGGFFLLGGIVFIGMVVRRHGRRASDRANE